MERILWRHSICIMVGQEAENRKFQYWDSYFFPSCYSFSLPDHGIKITMWKISLPLQLIFWKHLHRYIQRCLSVFFLCDSKYREVGYEDQPLQHTTKSFLVCFSLCSSDIRNSTKGDQYMCVVSKEFFIICPVTCLLSQNILLPVSASAKHSFMSLP